MPISYSLRPTAPEDGEFLYRVYRSTREEELAATGWDEPTKEAFLRSQFALQSRQYHAANAHASFHVILRNEQPVGRLYVDRREDDLHIIDIALLPESRNLGIGSSLIGEIQAEAQAAGKTVSIYVEMQNPALRLYHRLGFRFVSEHGPYFLMVWRP